LTIYSNVLIYKTNQGIVWRLTNYYKCEKVVILNNGFSRIIFARLVWEQLINYAINRNVKYSNVNYNRSYNLKVKRHFSTTRVNSFPREDYEHRSENKQCRYDVITHLTTKKIMLKEVIDGSYDKDNWSNDEERIISKSEAQNQLSEVQQVRNEVDSNRIFYYNSYEKAKELCEKSPTSFNAENVPFPNYDGNATPWSSEDEDYGNDDGDSGFGG
jgi:hypothetical protein